MRDTTSQLFTVNVPPFVTMILPATPLLPAHASLTLGTVLLAMAVPPLPMLPMAQPPELLGTPPFQLAGSFHEPRPPVQSLARASRVDTAEPPAMAARMSDLMDLEFSFFIRNGF